MKRCLTCTGCLVYMRQAETYLDDLYLIHDSEPELVRALHARWEVWKVTHRDEIVCKPVTKLTNPKQEYPAWIVCSKCKHMIALHSFGGCEARLVSPNQENKVLDLSKLPKCGCIEHCC